MEVLAVKWAYRYHSLMVDYFDSLDDAVNAAGYASDYGEEALDCIEVWDEQGHRTLSAGEVFKLYAEEEKRREEEAGPPKPVVAQLYITSPEGKEVRYSSFTENDRVDEVAARLREHLGDRVRVQYIAE